MGRIMDIVDEWERNRKKQTGIDGHQVAEIIMETDRMIIFRDLEGNLWRRVHAWGMTWPVTIRKAE